MKCRFFNRCKDYDEENDTCNNESFALNYYGIARPCGCYRNKIEESLKERK